jgi:DNA-binding MarR family transcriptional regulator
MKDNNNLKAFIKIYNETHGTSLSVKSVLASNEMMNLYNQMINMISENANESRLSTKNLSLLEFRANNGNRIQNKVYDYISTKGVTYRAEIAQALGLRISTVCARISELHKLGLLKKVGKTLDVESKRLVETISVAA